MMKEFEDKLEQALVQHRSEHTTSSALDDRILKQVARRPIWRTFTQFKRTWISGLAALVAMALALSLMNQTTPAAYALAESVKAMESVQNVSFRAFLYMQQMEILCHLQFEEEQRKPTHVSLTVEAEPIAKIDNEYGAFAYNQKTNRFRRNRRDERVYHWYPDFRQLLTQAIQKAQWSDDVTLGREIEPKSQQEMITIDVIEKYRQVRYWIDPNTKLPMRMTTQETFDLQALRHQTIAVRDIWDIHYNESLPEDTFVIPPDAQEVTEEVDVYLCPGMGMEVGTLSEEEACLKLVEKATASLNALDFETASQLYFPMSVPPTETLQKLQTMADQSSSPLLEVLEIRELYRDEHYWYVPCKVKDIQRGVKLDLVRIRFFEFDGVCSCIIAMPD